MTERDRYELKMAGLLHDCGKITTPCMWWTRPPSCKRCMTALAWWNAC